MNHTRQSFSLARWALLGASISKLKTKRNSLFCFQFNQSMKQLLLTSAAALALISTSSARTWTSADGSKTFEGEFISSTDNSFTVKQGFKEHTYKLAILSEEDQQWVKAEGPKVAAMIEKKKADAAFAESDLGKSFQKLQKLKGKKFAKYELTEVPKYFLLYFSASW